MAAKLEWGAKRTCLSCAARFYDMRREPITCPKCNTVFDPEAAFRPRRARSADSGAATKAAAKKKKAAPVKVAKAAATEPEDVVADLDTETPEGAADDGDDDVIEDTSDLGGGDDDLPPTPSQDDEDST